MKINLIERQTVQPGGSRGPTPGNARLEGAFGQELSALGREVGAIGTELAEREAIAKRASIVSERVAGAHVEFADWFENRTNDPTQHEALVNDTLKFQQEQRKRLTDGLDERTKQAVALHLEPFHAGEAIRARATASRQGRDMAIGRLDRSIADLELSAAQARTPDELKDIIAFGKASIDAQFHAGSLTDAQAGERQRRFSDRLYVNQIERDLGEAPKEVLALLQDQRNYADLRPDLRTRFIDRAKAIIKGQEAEKLALLGMRVKEADYALDRGYVPPDLDQIIKDVKGTKLERDMAFSVHEAGQVAAFALQPPRVQDEIVAQARVNRTRSGRDVMLLERLEKTRERQAKQFKDDPLQLGVELGVQPQLDPLRFDDRDATIAGLRERAAAATRLEGHFGKTVAPLFARDLDRITTVLREGDVSSRLSVLGALNDGLGDKRLAGMGQIADKGARQLAYAGAILRTDPEGARLLVTGIKQREANKAIVPKEADLTGSTAMGNLLEATRETPEARADMSEAVRNIYATLAAETGTFNGSLDKGLLEKAIEHATGGVIEYDPGIFVTGSMIIAPRHGVTEREFSKWVNGLSVADLADMGGIKGIGQAEALKLIKDKGQLRTVGPGRYLVQIGGGYLMRADGEPFTLNWPEGR